MVKEPLKYALMVDLPALIEMAPKVQAGCIFCSERGSGDHLKSSLSIREQTISYFSSYRSKRANKFILYFQNFSNTYAPLQVLKEKYDTAIDTFNEIKAKNEIEGIQNKEIVCLEIATRPDCITEEIAKLLESYKSKLDVTVELGLQTANDETGKMINRCYNTSDVVKAVSTLRKYAIDVIIHIMVGLPNETHKNIEETVKFINNLDIQGVKIHSTYVVKDTKLCELYEKGLYTPPSFEEYIAELKYILNSLREDIIIHRISGDAPKDLLVAPEWNSHKKMVINEILGKKI